MKLESPNPNTFQRGARDVSKTQHGESYRRKTLLHLRLRRYLHWRGGLPRLRSANSDGGSSDHRPTTSDRHASSRPRTTPRPGARGSGFLLPQLQTVIPGRGPRNRPVQLRGHPSRIIRPNGHHVPPDRQLSPSRPMRQVVGFSFC